MLAGGSPSIDELAQPVQIALVAHVAAPLEQREGGCAIDDAGPRPLQRRGRRREGERPRCPNGAVAVLTGLDGRGEEHVTALPLQLGWVDRELDRGTLPQRVVRRDEVEDERGLSPQRHVGAGASAHGDALHYIWPVALEE